MDGWQAVLLQWWQHALNCRFAELFNELLVCHYQNCQSRWLWSLWPYPFRVLHAKSFCWKAKYRSPKALLPAQPTRLLFLCRQQHCVGWTDSDDFKAITAYGDFRRHCRHCTLTLSFVILIAAVPFLTFASRQLLLLLVHHLSALEGHRLCTRCKKACLKQLC